MMTRNEYEKNLMRMFDSLRTSHKGEESCTGIKCADCPFNEFACSLGLSKFNVFDTIEIVENWTKEHPVMTNAMKFEEIFGTKPSEISSCDDFWNKEYKGKKPKTDQQIDTRSEQECHEIHKRYGKGMVKEVKGFSSAYPSMCDLKIVINIDGTWLTIHDNLNTVVTIKLSDLNDIIKCEILNNVDQQMDTGDKQERHEMYKRYSKGGIKYGN